MQGPLLCIGGNSMGRSPPMKGAPKMSHFKVRSFGLVVRHPDLARKMARKYPASGGKALSPVEESPHPLT